jgi:hypothetical protein
MTPFLTNATNILGTAARRYIRGFAAALHGLTPLRGQCRSIYGAECVAPAHLSDEFSKARSATTVRRAAVKGFSI